MRVAFFGGTFDPPHRGHLTIAEAAIERLGLQRVIVAPVGVQPLKRGVAQTPYADRLAMVRLFCSADPRLVPSEIDAPAGDRPNYTYDTLLRLRAEMAPADELFLLMGADSFRTLRQWHRVHDLLGVCSLVVAERPGASIGSVEEWLPAGVSCTPERLGEQLSTYALHGGAAKGRPLFLLPDLEQDISATAIREALVAGDAAERTAMLDAEVAAYASQNGLYRVPAE